MRQLLTRELRLSLRHGTDSLAAILFFLVAGALFWTLAHGHCNSG